MPSLFPIVRELPADLETPVSIYLKVRGDGPSFLLESITGGEQVARYSFIGVQPSRAFVFRDREVAVHGADGAKLSEVPSHGDLLDVLRSELARHDIEPLTGLGADALPRFTGGLAGYLGYDVVRDFEPSLPVKLRGPLPDAIFLLADTVVAFDHAFGRLLMIANARVDTDGAGLDDGRTARMDADRRLDALQDRILGPLPAQTRRGGLPAHTPPHLSSNRTVLDYTQAVRVAKDHIVAGDIFQVVLSQRFSRQTSAEPFEIYRALRRLNPSPYMFFFDFASLASDPAQSEDGPLYLIGASPEMHVRLEGRQAAIRPIAGTRPRGADPATDVMMEEELLADPKECAEHIMLVDLARNDLGRVCEFGSVRVPELNVVERYSHVMHIASHVEGKLRPEFDGFDLMRATFPAGTVSGAPKIRAMEIIHGLEPDARGPYAGAVGYFGYDGSVDTCITIRTLVMKGQNVSVQAGAGIVADSDPEKECQETVNKAGALAAAVEMAEAK